MDRIYLRGYKGKRVFDLVLASLLLIFLSPIFCFVAVSIMLFSGSPIFYRDKAIGLNGKYFRTWKFRTMVNGAKKTEREVYKINGDKKPIYDHRITKIGKIWRNLSLDELPNIFNVLLGEMSLVGPRQVPQWIFEQIPGRENHPRFLFRPGITGPIQIFDRSLKNHLRERLRIETCYLKNSSFKEDLFMILKTIPAIIVGTGQ